MTPEFANELPFVSLDYMCVCICVFVPVPSVPKKTQQTSRCSHSKAWSVRFVHNVLTAQENQKPSAKRHRVTHAVLLMTGVPVFYSLTQVELLLS